MKGLSTARQKFVTQFLTRGRARRECGGEAWAPLGGQRTRSERERAERSAAGGDSLSPPGSTARHETISGTYSWRAVLPSAYGHQSQHSHRAGHEP